MEGWHDQNCQMEFRYEKSPSRHKQACRAFWCVTHNQWAYLHPIRVVAEYDVHFTDELVIR